MKMIGLYACLCAHALCALGLFSLSSGHRYDMYAFDPVALGVALYFGRRLAKSGAMEQTRKYFLSALIPIVLLLMRDVLVFLGSMFFLWLNSWAPPGGQASIGGLLEWGAVVTITVLTIVEACLILSIYRSKRHSVFPREEVSEETKLGPGGFRSPLAMSLWMNLGLVLVAIVAILAAAGWVKFTEDQLRRESILEEGERGGALIKLSWELAKSDFEEGNQRLFGLDGSDDSDPAESNPGNGLDVLLIPRRGESALEIETFQQFIDAYNFKMLQLVQEAEDAE